MSGILGDLFKKMMESGLVTRPQLQQNELVLEIDENTFKNWLISGVPEQHRNHINVEIKEKKILIKIKLF